MKNRLIRFLSVLRNALKELIKGEVEVEKPKQETLPIITESVQERAIVTEKAASNTSVPPFGQGLLCPICANKIPISMEILLAGKVICPSCLLQLKVDTQQSAETLNTLKELKKGFDKANERRNNV